MSIAAEKKVEMPFAQSLMQPTQTASLKRTQEKPDFTKVKGQMACQKPQQEKPRP
jgi:hypothetical protein